MKTINSTPKTIAATESEARNVSSETPCDFCAVPVPEPDVSMVALALAADVVADLVVDISEACCSPGQVKSGSD